MPLRYGTCRNVKRSKNVMALFCRTEETFHREESLPSSVRKSRSFPLLDDDLNPAVLSAPRRRFAAGDGIAIPMAGDRQITGYAAVTDAL